MVAESAVEKAMKKAESRIAKFILSMVQALEPDSDNVSQINQVVHHGNDGKCVIMNLWNPARGR